jgi:hypothetical protein
MRWIPIGARSVCIRAPVDLKRASKATQIETWEGQAGEARITRRSGTPGAVSDPAGDFRHDCADLFGASSVIENVVVAAAEFQFIFVKRGSRLPRLPERPRLRRAPDLPGYAGRDTSSVKPRNPVVNRVDGIGDAERRTAIRWVRAVPHHPEIASTSDSRAMIGHGAGSRDRLRGSPLHRFPAKQSLLRRFWGSRRALRPHLPTRKKDDPGLSERTW